MWGRSDLLILPLISYSREYIINVWHYAKLDSSHDKNARLGSRRIPPFIVNLEIGGVEWSDLRFGRCVHLTGDWLGPSHVMLVL